MLFSEISKKQAFLTHLSVSSVIFFVLAYLVIFHWYPSYTFLYDGGYKGLTTLFLVDVVLGPGLTLLVFKPGKPRLKLDMTIIIVLQIIALTYGIQGTYKDRSSITVFYYGKFSCLSQSSVTNVDPAVLASDRKQKLALLERPDTQQEYFEFMKKSFFNSMSELEFYQSLIVELEKNTVHRIKKYKLNMENKHLSEENRRRINNYLAKNPDVMDKYQLIPLNCRFNNAIAVFDVETINIIDTIMIEGPTASLRAEFIEASK